MPKTVLLLGTTGNNPWRKETFRAILFAHDVPNEAILDPSEAQLSSWAEAITAMGEASIVVLVVGSTCKPGSLGISFADIVRADRALELYKQKLIVAVDNTHPLLPAVLQELHVYLAWLRSEHPHAAIFDDLETAAHFAASRLV